MAIFQISAISVSGIKHVWSGIKETGVRYKPRLYWGLRTFVRYQVRLRIIWHQSHAHCWDPANTPCNIQPCFHRFERFGEFKNLQDQATKFQRSWPWQIGLFLNTAYVLQLTHNSAKTRKIFTGPTYRLLLRFTIISDVYRSLIWNKTTFTKHCLTQWISKLLRSFEIHRVRLYLVNFTSVAGMVNATVYKTETIFTGLRHGTLS